MATWSAEELSYCSNVHSGEALSEVNENLQRFISPVIQERKLRKIQAGLWLSNEAATELTTTKANRQAFAELLKILGIRLTSLNGFPYGNFHENVVKEQVYLPHWGDKARLDYTLRLAKLLAEFSPDDCFECTISTLPLGFASDWSIENQQSAELHFRALLLALIELEQNTGKRIRVCLEMEPGCVLETTPQLIRFFTETLPFALASYGISEKVINRYLGICYDICHQAVMFEDIEASLEAIYQADIVIGKIQVSSALRVTNATKATSLLEHYTEPRYLHQLSVLDKQGKQHFCSDLCLALANNDYSLDAEWRVHFHVPIQVEQLNSPLLSTTRNAIELTCRFLAAHPTLKPHLEVETYTWGVMPNAIRPTSDTLLIKAIAEELNWLETTLKNFNLFSRKD